VHGADSLPYVAARPDIALVSLGTTMGWRRSDESFAELVREAGASCEVVPVRLGRARRLRVAMALTDVVEATAARRAAAGLDARALVYSSITAALLQRPAAPYAVRFDTLAALNRPGLGGAWQRRREPGVLHRARLLLPLSRAAATAAGELLGGGPSGVVVPPPLPEVERRPRELDAAAYAGNPGKRGLDLLCRAWARAAPDGARLVVSGIEAGPARRYLRRTGTPEPPGVEFVGALPPERWLDTLARAGVFVSAARYEDFGIAQLEALGSGTPLVTLPTAGPNEALPLARRLAPELVAEDSTPGALAEALRRGLALDPAARERYAQQAARLLGPYRREAVGRVVADEVLPALLSES
jgi:glycosyltransferase involved in cell wall biosynthesis